jgi:hypothetical protein
MTNFFVDFEITPPTPLFKGGVSCGRGGMRSRLRSLKPTPFFEEDIS